MKQQCHISMIYLTWAMYAGGLAAKGIRSVPVVEAGARLLFGPVTTKELAEAVAEAQRVGV